MSCILATVENMGIVEIHLKVVPGVTSVEPHIAYIPRLLKQALAALALGSHQVLWVEKFEEEQW